MYDSDEVRDAARREALSAYVARSWAVLAGGEVAPLSALDEQVMNDALAAEGNPWQRAISEYLDRQEAQRRAWAQVFAAFEELAREVRLSIERVIEAFCGGLFEPLRRAAEAMRELAEAWGIVERPEPEPFVWRKRARRPEARPVHVVDAVAAGRHPAMSLRTRIRGGRR